MAQQTLHAWSTLRLHDRWMILHNHSVSAEKNKSIIVTIMKIKLNVKNFPIVCDPL